MMARATRVGAVLLTTVVISAGTVIVPSTALAAPGDVVITEIMYNPVSDLDGDEFLELTNIGGTTVDLSGWVFSGITLTFPAGASIAPNSRLVVSPDPARTQATYGMTAAYTYTGKLSNSGEKVSLKSGSTTIDTLTFATGDPWPTTTDGLGPSIEVIDPTLANDDALNWAASTAPKGTPGAANSVASAGLGPRITLVSATPNVPAVNEPVVVSATVTNTTAPPTVVYRTDFAAEQSAPMTLSATADVYTATLPGAAAGHLIRYRIQAANAARTSRFPRIDDSEIYKGVVVASGVTSELPVVEWFIADADYNAMSANPQSEIDRQAVIAYNGTVFDNVTVNVRGQFTQTLPKVSWGFQMAKNHDLLLPGLIEPVDQWAMQADFVDGSHGRSILGWDAYELAGVDLHTQMFPIRTQRNGNFQGMYQYLDIFDGTWREREGYSDDEFFKANDHAFDATRALPDVRFEKKNPDDGNYADLKELLDAIDVTGTPTTNYLLAHADIPQMINYATVTSIIQHVDSWKKNFYLSRESTTGRWEILPWDLDHTLGLGCCGVNSTFITPAEPGDSASELMTAIFAVPEWKAMYFRRLRTVVDQVLAPGRMEALYDARLAAAQSTIALDFAAWPYPSDWNYTNRRTNLFNSIKSRRATISNDARIPAAQSAAPNIVINEIQHSPTAGNGAEFIELYNPSATEAIDLSGWVISGGIDMTIQPGAVILPKKTMVFASDDPTFRTTYGGTVFVGGRFTGDLAAAETLTLSRPDASVADTLTYDATWPQATDGPSLALIDPLSDNSLSSSWALSSGAGGTPGAPNTAAPVATPPAPPTIGTAAAGNTSATVTWTAPASNGGSAITRYDVRVVDDLTSTQVGVLRTAPASATSLLVTGLTNGTAYRIQVVAVNTVGSSTPSAFSNTVTPAAVGGGVTFRASASANGSGGSVVVPASVQVGDQLLLFVTVSLSTTATTPAGWTLMGTQQDGTPDMRSWVFRRTAVAGTAGSSVSTTFGNTTGKSTRILVAYSGAASPTVIASSVITASSTTTLAAPTVNVANAGSAVVRLYANKTSAATTWTMAAGVTRRVQTANTGSGRIASAAGDSIRAAGASGTSTATSNAASGKGIAFSVVVPPAGVVPTNAPPTAVQATPSCALLTCTFDGSGSTDSDGTIASYAWTFGDGGTAAVASPPAHSYANGGTFTVVLTVTDNGGAKSTASTTVTVGQAGNTPPTAAFTYSCTQLVCFFDGTTSTDSGGDVTDYAWNFGDGDTATGSTPAGHSFPAAGLYNVTLTVTDTGGLTDPQTTTVTVADGGAVVGFRASSSANSSGGSIVVPATVQVGDQLLLFVTANTGTTATTPAGWTLLGTQQDGTPDMRSWVFTRTAVAGTASSTVTTTLGDTGGKSARLLVAYSGAAVPTVLASSIITSSSTVTLVAPTVTVAVSGSAVVRYWANKTATATVWTLPAEVTGRVQSVNSGSGRIASAAGDSVAGAGSSGTASATSDSAGSKGIAFTVVVPPA